MARDLKHFIHSLFLPVADRFQESAWRPSADIYRTKKGWLVKFDLAGVRPEDIALSADGSRLTVKGTRRDCSTEEGCHYYRMEISYSHFERSIDLPCDLSRAQIRTDYRDGMLLVSIHGEADQ